MHQSEEPVQGTRKIANIMRSEHSDTLPELLYLHRGDLVHHDMRFESEPVSFILLNSYLPWQNDCGTAGDGTDGYRVELFRKLREHDPWLVWGDKDWALSGNLSGRSKTPVTDFDSQYHQLGRWPDTTLHQASRSPRNPCFRRTYREATVATARRGQVV